MVRLIHGMTIYRQSAANIAALLVGRDIDALIAGNAVEHGLDRNVLDQVLTGRKPPTSLIVAQVATMLGLTVWEVLYAHDPAERARHTTTFAWCEHAHATGTRMHLRRRNPEAPLLGGGGLNTHTLCGQAMRGWDVDVPADVDAIENLAEDNCRSCAQVALAAFTEASR